MSADQRQDPARPAVDPRRRSASRLRARGRRRFLQRRGADLVPL